MFVCGWAYFNLSNMLKWRVIIGGCKTCFSSSSNWSYSHNYKLFILKKKCKIQKPPLRFELMIETIKTFKKTLNFSFKCKQFRKKYTNSIKLFALRRQIWYFQKDLLVYVISLNYKGDLYIFKKHTNDVNFFS